jgi:hypothetical protein
MKFDIQNATSWLNSDGTFHPIREYGSHSEWASHHNKKLEELFRSGWMRVTFIGDTIYISNDLSVVPNYKQKKSIIDLSIESNERFKKAIYENGKGKETTLFSSYDFSESNKHMNFKNWLETEDYRGTHQAPTKDDSPLHDLTNTYPDDIYGPNGARYYGHGDPNIDNYTISIIQSSLSTICASR